MRYNIENGKLVPVRHVTHNDRIISNPTDEIVDELNAGYPVNMADTPPEYDPETHRIDCDWQVIDGVICKVYKIEPLTEKELQDKRISQLETERGIINSDFEKAKNTAIEYNGRKYFPRYIQEYWAMIHTAGPDDFPLVPVSDVNNELEYMPFADFHALYIFMINKSAVIIQETNAKLVEIDKQLEALK